ncbi:MAG: DUF1638 domain-containing protein [Armatimonadetes bacterium]|nr:DUF1638 domain-containing protein [Armatimonadota bacterium]
MFLRIIACEVAFREICWVAARSPNLVDLEFLSQGYHDNSGIGRAHLQERIDAVPEGKFDALLLGYALCNNMVVGLEARHTPLVIPRAHDCITFFLGSKERYARVFRERPGTYYYTSGWLEHRERGGERVPWQQGAQLGPDTAFGYQELVEKYGEENARYVMETLGQWVRDYSHGTLISFDFTRHLPLEAQVRAICAENGWDYDEIPGDLGLLQRWVDGEWNEEEFLVVQPGEQVVATYDERILGTRRVAAPASPKPRPARTEPSFVELKPPPPKDE